ncbi:MAG: YbjQ family protein [Synechococcales cyanobacterium RU_4_20]|nr:YbjQ family protein [Synechococcales cyanobacterium RU_4_20]NJR70789.1 YbjQ family protein [Synechococcales cyanobacterium CRU_2_2]
MITTTTDFLQGYGIAEYLGPVTAEVVYGTNALRDFMAGLRDVFGGRTASYEKVFERGQGEAIAELEDRAQRLGADAVIGMAINTDSINIDNEGVLFLITATGTAVRLR